MLISGSRHFGLGQICDAQRVGAVVCLFLPDRLRGTFTVDTCLCVFSIGSSYISTLSSGHLMNQHLSVSPSLVIYVGQRIGEASSASSVQGPATYNGFQARAD